MPTVNLRYTPALEAFLSSYNAAGNPGVARLTSGVTAPLGGTTGPNVNKLTFTAGPSTPGLLPSSLILESFINNGPDLDVIQGRPLGGTGYIPLGNLRGLEIKVTADPLSTAEIEAGGPEPREIRLLATLSDTAGVIIYFTEILMAVTAPGQVDFFSKYWPVAIPADAVPKLTLYFEAFSPRGKVEVLTISESF